MREQRHLLRNSTSGQGEVLIDGARRVNCVVSNMSVHGAKLTIGAEIPLPSEFQLRATDLELDARATIVWRREDMVGVRFAQAI